jgi:hypothetical protein
MFVTMMMMKVMMINFGFHIGRKFPIWENINYSRSGAYDGMSSSHRIQTLYLKMSLPAETLGKIDTRVGV